MSQNENCSDCRPSALFRIGLWLFILATSIWGGRWLRTTMQDRAAEAPAAASVEESDSNHSARAEFLYHTLCAKCHGPEGHGDGEGVAELAQRPRDFSGETWRFPRTRESVRRVIADGIPGTPMPGVRESLSASDIESLAEYVLLLGERPSPRTPAAPDAVVLAIEDAGFRPVPALADRGTETAPLATPFTVTRTDGEALSLAELEGDVVLLHFWGTSCVHCLAEFSKLEELSPPTDSIQAMTILSVCVDEPDLDAVEDLGRKYAGTNPLYVDESGLLGHRFQVQTLPSFVLIDSRGRIVGTRTGSQPWSVPAVQRMLEQLARGDRQSRPSAFDASDQGG